MTFTPKGDGKTRNKYFVDGEEVPGVTKILDRFKNKDALMYWANKIGREQGLTLQEARKPATSAGTLAHDMVEAYIKGNPEPDISGLPEDVVKKANTSFQAYLSWEMNTRITISKPHMELELVSKKHRFGGRLDTMGFEGQRKLIILDWKTNDGFYPDMKYQLAAYSILWDENYPDNPITGGAHLCRLDKTDAGFSHHHFPDLEQEKADFISWRAVYPSMMRLDGKKGGVQ